MDNNGRLRELVAAHPLLGGDEELIEAVLPHVELIKLGFDDVLIGMGMQDSDLYLIFSGVLDIMIEGREVVRRTKGETVGELELISPQIRRVATAIARDKTVVGRIAEPEFSELAERFPGLWRRLGHELVRRLIGETTQ